MGIAMNWKKWLGYNAYKKLWSIIGGRPWTFIKRDAWHTYEILHIYFYLGAGFVLGLFYKEIILWLILHPYHFITAGIILNIIGILWAHFYWGTKWVKGQEV